MYVTFFRRRQTASTSVQMKLSVRVAGGSNLADDVSLATGGRGR